MKSSQEKNFITLAIILLCFYLFQYIKETANMGVVTYPFMIDVTLFVTCCVYYLWIYRRDGILCFEIMTMPVAFLGLFYDELIYPIIPDLANSHFVSNLLITQRSTDLQMVGYLAFLLGCAIANKKKRGFNIKEPTNYVHYNLFLYVVAFITIIVVIYDYRTGVFQNWFFYSNIELIDREEKKQGVNLLTNLVILCTILDVARLREEGVNNFKDFVQKCNKISISLWLLVSGILLVSGNRNEMLLVFMPMIVAYTICIKKISNFYLFCAFFLGILLMVASGSTRQSGTGLSAGVYNLVTLTIDFRSLGYCCDYLISYSDKFGHTNFLEFPQAILTGIPFLGHRLLEISGFEAVTASAVLTTESEWTSSGLGTSLIGDLYYTSGALWVIIFMLSFGYLISRLYYSPKNVSIYLLFFYSYMLSNSTYYIRSSWAFPITRLEYVCILLFLGRLLFRVRKSI